MSQSINSVAMDQNQSRYNDIMRSINNTEQFIKAKQAIAQEKAGRNVPKRQLHLSDVQSSVGSTLM